MALMSSSGDCRPSTATACDHAEARPDTEFFCKFGAGDFAAFGRFNQIGHDAVGDFRGQNVPHLFQQIGRIAAGGKSGNGIAQAGLRQVVVGKRREQRLAFRHQPVKFAALAAQHVATESARRHNRDCPSRESET